MAREFKVYHGSELIKQGTSPLQVTGLETGTIYPEGYFQLSAYDTLYENESAKVDVPGFTTLYTNILPPVTAKTFSLGDGATTKDGTDGEVIFTLNGTNQLLKYDTTLKLPQLTEGKNYTISADIKFHSDIVGDVRNLRLSYNYLPGGEPVLQTTTPIPDTTKDKWIKIKGTNTIKYGLNPPSSWYLLLRDIMTANRISGTISLKNFQVVEGDSVLPKKAT